LVVEALLLLLPFVSSSAATGDDATVLVSEHGTAPPADGLSDGTAAAAAGNASPEVRSLCWLWVRPACSEFRLFDIFIVMSVDIFGLCDCLAVK